MIRAFESKDLDEVMAIWFIGNLQAHSFISKKYWEKNYEEVEQVMQLATVYVCEEDGKILGFASSMDDFMVGLFVREGYRDHGIGAALLEKEMESRDNLSLAIYEKNVRAARFFMKEHFEVQSERMDESTKEIEFLLQWERA